MRGRQKGKTKHILVVVVVVVDVVEVDDSTTGINSVLDRVTVVRSVTVDEVGVGLGGDGPEGAV